MAKNTEAAPRTFHDLGLAPQILNVLEQLEFKIPTPIQQQAIPLGLAGNDLIGIAQTGTGKTLAFGLPMVQRLIRSNGQVCGRSLIVLPTRELALQVDEALRDVGSAFGVRTAVLIGGESLRPQWASLARNPDILVATPGRLIDHLQQRRVDLRTVDVLVLDEADRMLDMGFAPQINQILRAVPSERQTMLFSATMPEEIARLAKNHMTDPVRVEVARSGTVVESVTQELFVVPQEEKSNLLGRLLRQYQGTVLVFSRTRARARRVARQVRNQGHSVAEIHSDRTLPQRRAALDGFKEGKYRVLVATDVAARGIDVSDIEVVLNFDLPNCPEDYIHRIGRTARAGRAGHAISFASPEQESDVRAIERLTHTELTLAAPSERFLSAPSASRNARRPMRHPSQSRPCRAY